MTDYNFLNSKRYNLYNLEAEFRAYLLAGNVNKLTVKNYLSDFRHFAGWANSIANREYRTSDEVIALNNERDQLSVVHYPQSDIQAQTDSSTPLSANVSWITKETIQGYKSYLQACNLPYKTVNRRLSTVRKFFALCIQQGWMTGNPAKEVGNVTETGIPNLIRDHLTINEMLNQVQHDNKSVRNDHDLLHLMFEYENELQAQNKSEIAIKKELIHLNEFMSIINSQVVS